MMTGSVLVGLGSNLGESGQTLLDAWHYLGEYQQVELIALSPPFVSSPVDMSSVNWFTNAAGHLRVQCSAMEFLAILMDVEQHLGRRRDSSKPGYQDRTIDLDLIYFDKEIIEEPRLVVPHPNRLGRLFVLAPLAVIAPDFVDPLKNKSLRALYDALLVDMAEGRLEIQEISLEQWPGS